MNKGCRLNNLFASISTTITIGLTLTISPSFAEKEKSSKHFQFGLEDPNVMIVIPELPAISLKVHPLHGQHPHLRFMGSGEGYNISIMTPTADAGMTPEDCAIAQVNQIAKREKLKEDQYSLFKSEDKTTFGMFHAYRLDETTIQLSGHLFSAAGGKDGDAYCIDIHISKITENLAEARAWRKGMKDARILVGVSKRTE